VLTFLRLMECLGFLLGTDSKLILLKILNQFISERLFDFQTAFHFLQQPDEPVSAGLSEYNFL